MKHFLWCFGGSQDVTIGFFGGIGRCDGTAPSALAATGSALRILHSRFRRFSLRLRCLWLRLRCSGFGLAARASAWLLLALSSPLVVSPSLLLALSSPLMVLVSTACRVEFAASRTDFAARGFGFHGLPPPTCRTAHRRRCPHRESRRGAPITHKFHFKTLIPTC